jgi:hypothetical protein
MLLFHYSQHLPKTLTYRPQYKKGSFTLMISQLSHKICFNFRPKHSPEIDKTRFFGQTNFDL